MKLLIASHNAGKVQEFQQLLAPLGLEVCSLLDYPEIEEVKETGTTFEENARLKAEQIAREMHCLTLADDSGLSVPSLDNEPGVYSARYAGQPKDDGKNRQKLLKKMEDFTGPDRAGHFTTCIVVAYPGAESLVVQGQVAGRITHEEKGQAGFGYDSIFLYEPLGLTFAEMEPAVKNQISHRAVAVAKLQDQLGGWLEATFE